MKSDAESHGILRRGFTLVELMVSLTVLAVLMSIIYAIIDQVGGSWSGAGAKVAQFKEARAASEAISQRLSQATLNTYWGYDDPSLPTEYLPQSELHFITGKAADFVPGGSPEINPAHSIFFVAPLGFTADDDIREFTGLLNACGFYIEYGSDDAFRPPALDGAGSEERWRFRLMEYRQPAEDLQIYNHRLSEDERFSKWREDRGKDANRPLAENIIALILAPSLAREEASPRTGQYVIAPNFEYDSRLGAPEERHQLPPIVRVIMVAMDEGSAARMDFGPTPPKLIPDGIFESVRLESDLMRDVGILEQSLIDQRINFRTFHSVVPLRAAKWKPN